MGRYETLFTSLTARREGAFIPFIVLGDPTFNLSLELIDVMVEHGADALELGIPFSDPLADGPTIQKATVRAFQAGISPAICFEMLAQIRLRHPQLAIGLLVYANLVYHRGVDTFYQKCQQADIDSVLIADLPVEESLPFRQQAARYDIATVFICPPKADEALISEVAKHSQGYTYLLSRAGVTGAEHRAEKPAAQVIQRLRHYQSAPPVQGFGIAEPTQVTSAIQSGAMGAIAGSATIKIIEKHRQSPDVLFGKMAQFIRQMKAATLTTAW